MHNNKENSKPKDLKKSLSRLIKELSKYKVVKVNKTDGVKLYFDDNSWILVRPSGTEPLLRIYIECDSLEKIEEFKENIKNASIA